MTVIRDEGQDFENYVLQIGPVTAIQKVVAITEDKIHHQIESLHGVNPVENELLVIEEIVQIASKHGRLD